MGAPRFSGRSAGGKGCARRQSSSLCCARAWTRRGHRSNACPDRVPTAQRSKTATIFGLAMWTEPRVPIVGLVGGQECGGCARLLMAVDLTFEPHLTGGRPELTRDRGRFRCLEGSALEVVESGRAYGALGFKRRAPGLKTNILDSLDCGLNAGLGGVASQT